MGRGRQLKILQRVWCLKILDASDLSPNIRVELTRPKFVKSKVKQGCKSFRSIYPFNRASDCAWQSSLEEGLERPSLFAFPNSPPALHWDTRNTFIIIIINIHLSLGHHISRLTMVKCCVSSYLEYMLQMKLWGNFHIVWTNLWSEVKCPSLDLGKVSKKNQVKSLVFCQTSLDPPLPLICFYYISLHLPKIAK